MDPVKEKLNLLRRLASEKKSTPALTNNQHKTTTNNQASNKLTREASVNSNAETELVNETPIGSPNLLATTASLPRPNSLAYNKYINRIRSMYDKETPLRSASIEPAQIKPSTNRQSSPLIQSFTDQAKESPVYEEPGRIHYEISENDIDEEDFVDASTVSNNLLHANSINKYLRHVKSNGLFRMPSNRAASVENLQRNNHVFGNQPQQQPQQLELNQINRLKERFSKPDTRHASLESGNIHSNYSINNFLSLQNDTKNGNQYKSLRTLNRFDDYNPYAINSHLKDPAASTIPSSNTKKVEPSITYEIIENTPKMPEATVVAPSKESNYTTLPSNGPRGKQLHRYQRSRTSDLTDLIFGEQKERTLINENGQDKSADVVINNNYNQLVDKYATDLKYTPETAIIKSTMNQTRKYGTTIDAFAQQNQLLNNAQRQFNTLPNPNTQKKKSQLSIDKPEPLHPLQQGPVQNNTYNNVYNSIASSQPQPQEMMTNAPNVVTTTNVAPPKRTKSILKSPSTFNEKSIHFDDRIDVIPIRAMPEEDEYYDNEPGMLQTSKIIVNESEIDTSIIDNRSQELLAAPYSPVSERSRLIKAYSYYSSSTQLNDRLGLEQTKPAINFTNEIESIKKMLLEPKVNTLQHRSKNERNSISPVPVFMNSTQQQQQQQQQPFYHQNSGQDNYNQHRSRTERIFIKSPTPMREIGVLGDNDDENNSRIEENTSNYLRVPTFEFKSHLKMADEEDNSKSASPMSSRNNRQRFINKKKTAALRSQSVDLAKIMDNFEKFDDMSPPPQQAPPRMQPNYVPAPVNVHLKPGFVRAKAKSPSPRPSLTRQDALNNRSAAALANDLTNIEHALKSRLASNQQQQRSGSTGKAQKPKHHHHHRNHRNRYQKNRGSQLRHQQRVSSSSSSTASFSSSSLDEKEHGGRGRSSNSSLTSLASSQDLAAGYEDRPALDSNNDSDARYRRASIGGEFIRSANVSKLSKRMFYYSSDDSVCGIPKPSVNQKKAPKLCTSGKPFHKSMDELAYYRETGNTTTDMKRPPTGETKRKHAPSESSPKSTKSATVNSASEQLKNTTEQPSNYQADVNKYKYFAAEADSHVSRSLTKPTSNQYQQYVNNHQLHQQPQLPVIDPKKLDANYQQSIEYNNQRDHDSPLRNNTNATNNSHVKSNVATINNRNKPLPTYSQLYQRGHSSFNLNQPNNPTPTAVVAANPNNQFVKYDNNWQADLPIHNTPQLALNPKPIQYPQQSYLGNSNPSSSQYYGQQQQSYQPPLIQNAPTQQQQQQHVHANRRIPGSFHIQQARSKSLDAHMFADSPELGLDGPCSRNSQFNDQHQNVRVLVDEDLEDSNSVATMPQQSVAIQEKMRLFEQQQQQLVAHNGNNNRVTTVPGLATEDLTRFEGSGKYRHRSPFEIINKETSPYNRPQQHQQPRILNNSYLPINPTQQATMPSTAALNYPFNKFPGAVNSKPMSVKQPVVGYITPNLSAATAAAAAAVEAIVGNSSITQDPYSTYNEVNLSKSRSIKNEPNIKNMPRIVGQPSFAPTTAAYVNNLNYGERTANDFAANNNNNRVVELSRKLSQPQVTTTLASSLADRFDMSSSSATSSSNRSTHMFERPSPPAVSHIDEMLLQARINQTHQPEIASGFRRASFNKSTSSPLKNIIVTSNTLNTKVSQNQPPQIITPPQQQQQQQTASSTSSASQQALSEDIEMLSCSSSSTTSSSSSSPTSAASSYKENMLLGRGVAIGGGAELNNVESQAKQFMACDAATHLTSSGGSNEHYNSDSNASTNEPSKLSLSEKMKLFSNLNNSGKNNGGGQLNGKAARPGHLATNRANSSRYSTQPVSLADLEYVNNNKTSLNNTPIINPAVANKSLASSTISHDSSSLLSSTSSQKSQLTSGGDSSSAASSKQPFESFTNQIIPKYDTLSSAASRHNGNQFAELKRFKSLKLNQQPSQTTALNQSSEVGQVTGMVKQAVASAMLGSSSTLKKSNAFTSYIENTKPSAIVETAENNTSRNNVNTVKQVFSAPNGTTTLNKSQVSASFLNKNRIFISTCKQQNSVTTTPNVTTVITKPMIEQPQKTVVSGGESGSSTSTSPSLQSFSSSASVSSTSSTASSSSYSKLAAVLSSQSAKMASVGSIFKLNNPFLSNCKR